MPALHFSFLDYDKDPSGFSVVSPGDLTALNIAEYDVNGAGLAATLLTAMQAICRLQFVQASPSYQSEIDGVGYPADPDAQRSTKALISYEDSTFGRVHTAEMPGYNNVGLLPNSDEIDLTDADIAAFVAAFEAFAGPDGGSRTVLSMRKVARNL